MIDSFLEDKFSEITEILDHHKSIFNVNPDIHANSHLNMKDDIFLLVSFFSSFDDSFEDDLTSMMLDDVLSLLKYFDKINYKKEINRTFCANKFETLYKEYEKENQDIGFDVFKDKYLDYLKELRVKVIPVINTKLYYLDLLIWSKARASKVILRVLRNFGANDCFNTKDFHDNKSINFKSMVDYKYVAQNYDPKLRYSQKDIDFVLSLDNVNDNIDETYEENFNRLIGVKNKIAIFKGMQDGDIRLVVKDVFFMKYNPHETIIREGELGDDIYFIVSGTCRVTANHKAVGLLKEHQIFGEFSAITKDLRTATIRTNSIVTVLSFKLATELFEEIPESFSNLYKNVIDELIKKIDLSNQKKY